MNKICIPENSPLPEYAVTYTGQIVKVCRKEHLFCIITTKLVATSALFQLCPSSLEHDTFYKFSFWFHTGCMYNVVPLLRYSATLFACSVISLTCLPPLVIFLVLNILFHHLFPNFISHSQFAQCEFVLYLLLSV